VWYPKHWLGLSKALINDNMKLRLDLKVIKIYALIERSTFQYTKCLMLMSQMFGD